jgi:hypothetical protein
MKTSISQNKVIVKANGVVGPQGPKGGFETAFEGDAGIIGSLNIDGNQLITGSLTVSGSGTLENIGPFNQTGISTLVGETVISGSLNVTGGITGSIGPSLVLNPIVEYLNTHVTFESNNFTSDSTVRVLEASFATVPTGFAPINKFDFQYYINGVLIPPSRISSIVDNSTNVDITFNTGLLGFVLDSNDLVTVSGKFKPNGFNTAFSSGFGAHVYNFVSEKSTLVFQ